MAINDRGVNAVSITQNESIVLFGHDVNFRSDDTFNLIILVAKFLFTNVKLKRLYHSFIFSSSILEILSKYINTTQK